MIRNVLEHISGIASFPVVALVLFILVFVGMVIWALRLQRSDVDRLSRLPLEDDHSEKGEGASNQ